MAKILGGQVGEYTINTEQLSNTAVAAFTKSLAPKIQYANVASNTYTILDDTAVNVGGGYIVITGADFQSGATVLVDTTLASSVTYVTSNTIQAQVPAKSAASYNLYVINPDGGIGIKVSGITYSGSPTWVTTSPLTGVAPNTIFSGTFSATGASSYSNTSVLPTGFNLLANGYYYGNISVSSSTTYNFTIRATDAELQDSDKTFSLTVEPQPYSIDYLVVAGGGGGQTAGGGAGGFLSGNTSLTRGVLYTISIGSGGSPGYLNGSVVTTGWQSGSNSYIYNNSTSANVAVAFGGGVGGGPTAVGGGGVSPLNGGTQIGGQGGSGGGSGGNITAGSQQVAGGLAIGSPGIGVAGSQGYPGGPTWGTGNSPSGGGGGAGGAGTTGSNISGQGGGPGGIGAIWPFTGPATFYAGGGGGSSYLGGAGGTGGSGGGGPGGPGTGSGTAGTPGTGGGGGAAEYSGQSAGGGGSGIIILSIPTPSYPGSAPGATVTTPPAAPGRTVLTYTSSGTYIA